MSPREFCDWGDGRSAYFGGWIGFADGWQYYRACGEHAPLVGGAKADRLPYRSPEPAPRRYHPSRRPSQRESKPRGRPVQNTERDNAIANLAASGKRTQAEIATMYGLTPERIRQIIKHVVRGGPGGSVG